MEKKKVNLIINEVEEKGKTKVSVSDGKDEVKFTKFKKGVYTVGSQKAADFIKENKASLSGKLTESAMNLMVAVSENEGNLDAVNTWDNSFMTFGMFQWTIGVSGDPGELAALVKKIKEADESVFEKYFGQYGLNLGKTGKINGYFTLKGADGTEDVTLNTSENKELLRNYEWAYYFWHSGQDPLVKSVEIDHALSRIDTFYKSGGYKVSYKGNKYYIQDIITSEYDMALILDNHVNRPGYVRGCLEQAVEKANPPEDVSKWGTDQERSVIDAYIEIRKTYGKYPMTHAEKRAEVVKKYLDNKTISHERGSFKQA
jgi:hypothetical protein